MIKTYAQVDKAGNVVCVCQCEHHNMESFMDPAGQTEFVEAPEGEEPTRIIESYKWHGVWMFVGYKPSQFHKWGGKRWEYQPDEAKAAKWSEIKAARGVAEWAGFEWEGKVFDSGPASQQRIQLMSLVGGGMEWTLADNTSVWLTQEQRQEVLARLVQHVAGQHAKARSLRLLIDSATTKEDLEHICWV